MKIREFVQGDYDVDVYDNIEEVSFDPSFLTLYTY